jgi:hypothetical protein
MIPLGTDPVRFQTRVLATFATAHGISGFEADSQGSETRGLALD